MFKQPSRVHPAGRARRGFVLFLAALFLPFLALGLAMASPAAASCGGTTVVYDETDLNSAIAEFNSQVTACPFTIELGDHIALSSGPSTPIQNSTSGVDLTLEGAGHTLTNLAGTRLLTILAGTVVTINNLEITEGIAPAETLPGFASPAKVGGGILAMNADVTINDSLITQNNAYGDSTTTDAYGGGIAISGGSMAIHRTTIAANRVSTLGGYNKSGGGILLTGGGTLLLVDSTLVANEVRTGGGQNYGGGLGIIDTVAASDTTIINSTFSENEISGGSLTGGAIGHKGGAYSGSLTIINSTIYDTLSSTGSSVFMSNANFTMANSIIGGSDGSDCVAVSSTVAIDYSLIEDSGSDACDAVDNVGGNDIGGGLGHAQVGHLASNGGPTQTYALLEGSPAIDTGDTSLALDENGAALISDQRGSPYDRVAISSVDMGAYEAQCSAFPRAVTNEAELRDAIACFNRLTTPGEYEITFNADITLSADLNYVYNPTSGVSLLIEGASQTLDGGFNYEALLIESETPLTINELAIINSAIGISSHGPLTVHNSTIAGNLDGISMGDNGSNVSSLVVRDSAIVNNRATGILVFSTPLEVINSTIADNGGPGIGAIDYPGTLQLTQTTITGNTVGLYTEYDGSIDNSILAGNGSDCQTGNVDLSARNSLIGAGLGCINDENINNLSGDPLLAPLGDYGGATKTRPPLVLSGSLAASSPVIDAGDNNLAVDETNSSLTYDQRGSGFPRIVNAIVDMGAAEGGLSITCPAFPAAAADESDLNEAIICYNAITTPGQYTINLTGNIDLSASTAPIDNANAGVSLLIYGDSHTVDGQDNPGLRPFAIAADTTATFEQFTITGGRASGLANNDGGAILNGGDLTLSDMALTFNYADDDGGGVTNRVDAALTIEDSTISNNEAGDDGGAIYNDGESGSLGTVAVEDSIFSNNAAQDGGGIANEQVMTIRDSVIIGNTAGDLQYDVNVNGGGVFNEGSLEIHSSTISGNSLSGSEEVFGAGIANQATLVLSHSTVSGNMVYAGDDGRGGGLFFMPDVFDAQYAGFGARVAVINSTFSNNGVEAGDVAYGGGLYARDDVFYDYDGDTILEIVNSTFSDNEVTVTAGSIVAGGGVRLYQEHNPLLVTIDNSILANSTTGGSAGDDCALGGAASFDSNNSLYEDSGPGACGLAAANPDGDGNIVGQDPNLGVLQNNGGPTETHTLLAGSPAIDAGNNALALDENGAALTTDQRGVGYPRIAGAAVDMGAVEICGFPFSASNEAELNTAIGCFNAITSAGTYQINLTADILLTASTQVIQNTIANPNLIIEGNGFTVDGQNIAGVRPFNLHNGGTDVLRNITVTGGTTGGVMTSTGSLTIIDSAISGNSAEFGGGVSAQYVTVNIINSTISNNQASVTGGGLDAQYATLNVINSTLNDNEAATGGGLFVGWSTTVNLDNSIIANSLSGGDCYLHSTGEVNARHSLIEDGLTCVNGTDSNNLTGDPNLGPLQDNGGATKTHALLAGSPAINTGSDALAVDQNAAALTTDQRGTGYDRIVGGTVDIGAFEFGAGSACPDVPGNIISNYCFEDGSAPWRFFTDGKGSYVTSSANPYQGQFAAQVAIEKQGSNVQLYQKNLPLEPDTTYELSFAAYSSNGNDLRAVLHEHDDNYTNYGLDETFDLSSGWQVYQTQFTTTGFNQPVNDARLRFWLAPFDEDNMSYHIDWVVLREVDGNPPIPPDPPVIVPPPGQCNPDPNNLLVNGGFENGTGDWNFYTDGGGSFSTDTADPYECASNAVVDISDSGGNVQLYQKQITLQGGETYRLRLAARSNNGQDVKLFVHDHRSPYSSYGLNGVQLDLTPEWQVFVVDFTAKGTDKLKNARLRIWMAPFDDAGTRFEFDDVLLLPKSLYNVDTSISSGLRAATYAADTTALQTAKSSGAPGILLRQGYFLDGYDQERLEGGYVPDNGAPFCYAARPSLQTLLPANGKMATLNIVGLGNPANVTIESISQDEPLGDEPDAVLLGGSRFQLRRERDENGEGRVYLVSFSADYDGFICEGTVAVSVPPDRTTVAINNGASLDSTGGTLIQQVPGGRGGHR